MCKHNPKSVIYLSVLRWRHHGSHPGSGTEFAPRLQFEVFLLMDPSNVCLPKILPDPKQYNKIFFNFFWLVSNELQQPVLLHCLQTGRSKGCRVSPTALLLPAWTVLWQTSNCHLVSCVWCLISLFWARLICQHMLKIKCSNDAK